MVSGNPADHLVIAADYNPQMCGGIAGVMERILKLGSILVDLGVTIKVNASLRALGYDLIDQLHRRGLRVMVDLKLHDIPETMDMDGHMLAEHNPAFVTVMCSAGIEGMRRVRIALPDTKVIGVSVLTSLTEEDCQLTYGCSVRAGVLKFARMAQLAGIGGLVCSAQEAQMLALQQELSLELHTPGIRPTWSLVADDDQQRITTPAQAIRAGATRIIVGRPITQAKDPRDAVRHILEEIQTAMTGA